MKRLLKISDRSDIEIFVISLAILLYLSRTAIPFFKFPFIPIYFGLIIYTVFTFNTQLFKKIKEFARNYSLLLLLATILFISFILSNKLYLTIFKDVCNSIILFSLYYLLSLFITKKNGFNVFIITFLNLLILFAFVISVNGLASFFNIFSIGEGISSRGIPSESIDGFLSIDTNFAQLIVFFGMIGLIFLLIKTKSFLKILLIDLLLSLYSINILFSGSRRGLITLIGIVGFLIIAQLVSLFKSKTIFNKIASASLYYFISLIFLMGFFWCFTNYTSYTFKNRSLEFIGSKNPERVRMEITSVILKYISVFNKNDTYPEIYKKIWTPNLNPNDPDSGWGTRKHKTIYPLTGENVEIVPVGSKGYLMDKSCNSDTRAGNVYSYTTISNEIVTKNNILEASVFCYVSNDFDGEWALLTCEGATEGKKEDEYDLKLKGTWQKLSLKVKCLEGNAPVYLYFSKFGVTDFSSLNGYVIFAFPKVEIIERKDSILSRSEKLIIPTSEGYRKNEIRKFEPSFSYSKSIPESKEPMNFNKTQFTIVKGYTNNKKTYRIINVMEIPDVFKVETFGIFLPLIPLNIFNSFDKDPIRTWFAKLISEDTTYYGYKNELSVNTISNKYIGDRILRWQFTWQIFIKEYNWKQKIFGGGFNFLNWYGFYFLKDKTLSDYPHNPFLSILLYSGIVGLCLYFFLLFKVFYYYLKYLKEYYLFFIFFLITFFFSFFSGGSPFDPPIMGFFMLLPFFIHSIHKKDNYSLLDKRTNDKDFNHRDQ